MLVIQLHWRRTLWKCCPFDTAGSSDYDLGVYYFPGWGNPCGGPLEGGTSATAWGLITNYPGLPVAGVYTAGGVYDENDANTTLRQANCDKQLREMAYYGIKWVAVVCYWNAGAPFLTGWINSYLASTVPNKPKLVIAFDCVAHSPNATDWVNIYNYWNTNYTNNAYYKKDSEGKPIIIMFGFHQFKANIGGGTDAGTKAVLDAARAVGNFNIKACVSNPPGEDITATAGSALAQGYDGLTHYAVLLDEGGTATNWSSLMTMYNNFYDQIESYPLPCILPVSTGFWNTNWDKTGPAGAGGEVLLEIAQPTISQFEEHLTAVKARLDASENKMAIIEAWNEYGEGSVLEPSAQNGGIARGMMVKKVFGL